MPNKKVIRKKAFNRFRLYPVAQKYVQQNSLDGNIQDDYINHDPLFLPCDKTSFRSQDQKIMHTSRIITQFKIFIRWCDYLSLQDRLLFLSENQVNYGPDEILKINAMHDRTGRREYLELYCARGEYAGPVTYQPEKTLLVIKAFSPTKAELLAKITETLNESNDFVKLVPHGTPDLIIPNIGNKSALLATGQPFIITPPEITQIQADLGSEQYDFTSQNIMDKAKLWEVSHAIKDKDYLRLSYSNT